MKLFALAATTAVTARDRWAVPRRVNKPAPGYVNEQGGYWADQPTQQSNQYRQPPQPSFQKPQCCQGYYKDGVFMEQFGENDMKPIYKGEFNGNDMYLFWHFEEVQDNRPFMAVPGAWYFGTDFNDPSMATAAGTIDSHALRYCPQDQINIWPNGERFECGQAPQATQPPHPPQHDCCEAIDYRPAGQGGDRISMVKTDDEFNNRPVYQGEDKVMFWKFVNVTDNRPVQAVPGSWYIGTGTDDESALPSRELDTNGYKSCPSDQQVFWGRATMQCGQARPVLDTCDADWKAGPNTGVFYNPQVNGQFTLTKEDPRPPECNLLRVMAEIGRSQFNQFVWELDNSHHQLGGHYDGMINKWREMADNSRCHNFNSKINKRNGQGWFISDCSSICNSITEITTPGQMAGLLEAFAATLADFNTSKYQVYFNNFFSYYSRFIK